MTIIDRPSPNQDRPTTPADGSARREAASDLGPFLLALVPFSLAIGASSAAAGFSLLQTVFGVFTVFAGSAQLAGVDSIRSGGGVGVTVMIMLLVSARFAFYGAGLARWFVGAPRWKSFLLAGIIVDQSFLLCQERFAPSHDVRWRVRYYIAVTFSLVVCFAGCQIVGYTIGGDLPPSLGLHLAAPLAFAGMLAKSTTGRPTMTAAITSGFVLILASGPIHTAALPLAVLAGVITGASSDTSSSVQDRTAS